VRIVTWNVNGAGRAKVTMCVARLTPDILIAPECEDPARSAEPFLPEPTSSIFIGSPGAKGLTVLSYGDHTVELRADLYDSDLVRIAPIEVNGPYPCRLLAVWADNAKGRRPLLQAFDHYADWLTGGDVVVAGDFNDGPKWSGPGDSWPATADRLAALGLVAAPLGPTPTFYMYRHVDKPYQVDHVFVPRHRGTGLTTVGDHLDWSPLSDHMPVTVDLQPSP
jgi:exodeoxyribonuclease-3